MAHTVAGQFCLSKMIRSAWVAMASGRGRFAGRGFAVALVVVALGGGLLACGRGPHPSPNEPISTPALADSAQEPTDRNLSSSDMTDVVDLDSLLTESLVAQQGTCLPTERGPGRSRLIYSLLPTRASYLRLTVVTSPDGARPVMVDLARGLTAGRILYATLTPSATHVRLQTFRSANDKRPLVTDLPLGHPVAQHVLLLGERALTLPCPGH